MSHSVCVRITPGILCLAVLAIRAFALDPTPQPHPVPSPLVLNVFSAAVLLPNGVQVKSGSAILDVRALRDDVVGIRIGVNGQLPEDASWAVLANSRRSSVSITSETDADGVGFRTRSLRVKIARSDLRLSVSDLEGNILQEDAEGWPMTYHGPDFRIYKTMPGSEPFFGYGDETVPLDRRGQSFVLWNTDAYRFQESAD